MSFSVRVAKPSMTTRTIEVENGETVRSAVERAGFSINTGEIVQLGGITVDAGSTLNADRHAGSVITVSPGAKGAR